MNWEALSDRDKVRLLLQYVLPHEMADDIRFEQNHIQVSRRWTPDHPVQPVNWPVAAWDDAGECWWTCDIWSNWDSTFDPLYNLNDTWKIIESLQGPITISLIYVPIAYQRCEIVYGDKRETFTAIEKSSGLAICRTILYALGILDVNGEVRKPT